MSYPLTYKDNGVLKIMSTEEFSTFAQAVLEYIAENDGPGALSFSSNLGEYNEIGFLSDTVYEDDIGGSNTSINANVIYLYQDLTTPTGTEPPRVLLYNDSNTPLKLTSNVQIDDLANSILTWGLTNEGPGSYQIATATPDDGGTWSNVGSITEIYSGSTTNAVNLYKKLSSGVYTLERPLTVINSSTIKKISDDEITYFSKKVRERIVTTGIGQYLLQADTPEDGTWVAKGSVIDTRASIGDVSYTADYTGEVNYTGEEPTVYTGVSDTAYFTGDVLYQTEVPFAGPLNYTTDTYFIGDSFIGPGPITYAGISIPYQMERQPYAVLAYFNGYLREWLPIYYAGSRYYVGNIYTATIPTNYVGPLTPYTLTSLYQVPGYYTGTVNYTINIDYTGAVTADFIGPGYYTGIIPTNYSGPLNYVGPDTALYEVPLNYTGFFIYAAPGNYTGPATFGTATYQAPDGLTFTAYLNYVGAGRWLGPVAYVTNNFAGYLGPRKYYVSTRFYIGPNYPYNLTVNYFGPRNYYGPVTLYLNELIPTNYLGGTPINYTGDIFPYEGPFFYTGPGFFLGEAFYQGLGPAYYDSLFFPYEGPIAVPYVGLIDTAYTSDVYYDTTYNINIIEDFVTTVETITLWRRVA